MPKITYRDLEKAAPTTTWFGIEFKDGEAIDLDQQKQLSHEQKSEMMERAKNSAFYKVDGKLGEPKESSEPPPPPPGVEAQVAAAHKAGRDAADVDANAARNRVPEKGGAWLEGYEERMKELEAETKKEKNTHSR